MRKTIKNELEKILQGKGFFLCILCTFALCLSADLYEDIMTGRRYSVIEALMEFSGRELAENWMFCSREVVGKGLGGWLSFFLPIVAAFPSVPLLCDEYRTKYVRYEILRSKKRSFYTAKLAASFLGGAMAVAAGYALFSLFACLVFPGPEELAPMALQSYQMIAGNGDIGMETLKILGCTFLAGGINVFPAVILSGITQNKYVVMCIPFFLKYGVLQICLGLEQSELFLSGAAPRWLTEINTLVNPDTPLYLFQYPGDIGWKAAAWCLAMVVFYSACYFIIQKRRLDCGE